MTTIITVTSPHRGTGTTTIATALSTQLHHNNEPVTLIHINTTESYDNMGNRNENNETVTLQKLQEQFSELTSHHEYIIIDLPTSDPNNTVSNYVYNMSHHVIMSTYPTTIEHRMEETQLLHDLNQSHPKFNGKVIRVNSAGSTNKKTPKQKNYEKHYPHHVTIPLIAELITINPHTPGTVNTVLENNDTLSTAINDLIKTFHSDKTLTE